jgi:hypothetical protein
MTDTPTTDAAAILDLLKDKADQILSASLGTAPLAAFQVTGPGNFFYNWQDATNVTLFNAKTYNWISANLVAGATPIQLGDSFTNLFQQALQSISWSLSTADQAALNKASASATQQAAAVQNAWIEAFGALPNPGGRVPMNDIAAEIAGKWAVPPTTLTAIKSATNLGKLLNNVPASGEAVLPVFANWLNALGSSVSLQNSVTVNGAYLSRALDAVQNPTTDNGGLALDDSSVQPAFQVTTQVSDILNALNSGTPQVSLSMTVSRTSESELRVQAEGGAAFDIPILDFLGVGVGGHASYFSDQIATSSNTVTVEMSFPGVNLVTFGPLPFRMSGASSSWYWIDPVRQAIANTGKDVSGFKFSPMPDIDFSAAGPFAYLQGVVISSYPTITITTKSADFASIEKTFEQSSSVSVSFLGIPLGGASESSYQHSLQVDQSAQTVTITLSPPPDLIAGTQNAAQGWVLGVIPRYPTA